MQAATRIEVFTQNHISRMNLCCRSASGTPGKDNHELVQSSLVAGHDAHGIDNLLAAGRNVSCDRPVLSAIRVMPPCFGLGEAAGNAAAIAIEQNCACATIDVKLLQQRLASENACLEK